MRKPERIPEVLDAIRKIWEANPDLRLGQLIATGVFRAGEPHGHVLFAVEDDLLLKRLYESHAPGMTPPTVEVFPVGGKPQGFGVGTIGREKPGT